MTSGLKSPNTPVEALAKDPRADALEAALNGRSIVLVGLMGSGKTSIGRRLALRLGFDFVDSDAEIETAAGMTIPEIFSRYGEAYFRDGERRVMARLLESGPRVIATGGGAFMNDESRERIAQSAVSIWLKADLDVLWRRVRKRTHRPLLQNAAPEATLARLMNERYPVYATANITLNSREGPHDAIVDEAMAALDLYLQPRQLAAAAHVGRDQSVSELSTPSETVRVELGARGYDILIGDGLLRDLGGHLRRLAPGAACAIVSDENVAHHYLAAAEESLRTADVRTQAVVVSAGETSKSYSVFEKVCEDVLAARLERGDFIVALGGGVIGDLAGFAAACIRRGMRFIQVPTSLLAQVDSSVGGKTAIDSPHGKNLIGAFHQPALVLADTDTLKTLPIREFRAGYAEIAKYGLINDAQFFAWLEESHGEIFAGGAARTIAIAKSCASKAAIVAADETEKGERALLNLGHTFGHALERLVNYDSTRLVHGEGVSIGVACAFRFSARQGLCSNGDVERVEAHFRAVGLPVHIRDIPGWDADPGAILDAIHQDKKVERGGLTFILAHGIGQSFVAKNVDPRIVLAHLQDELR
jgi:shikimate kinase / 3-dehydroquinate synthase